jgi:murein DD-endopeptidase MepM/ murein hydrolase activator NlpD
MYRDVEVAHGQTLYAISRNYNVPIRLLIDLNHLEPPYSLQAGQKIKIPTLPIHHVVQGDTLTSIARLYGVSVEDLARVNRLERPYSVALGSRLLIPITDATTSQAAGSDKPAAPPVSDASQHVLTLPPPAEPSTAAVPPQHVLALPPTEPPAADVASVAPVPLPTVPAKPPEPAVPPPSGRGFLWPVKGSIASGFGAKPGGLQNDGVNIIAARGTPVHAAADGVVVYAGNELRGYGNLLLIRHAGGWMSAYAHNDRLLVRRGDHVRRGETIAKVGGTGAVSSPQLHFELRRNGRPVDPLQVMRPM